MRYPKFKRPRIHLYGYHVFSRLAFGWFGFLGLACASQRRPAAPLGEGQTYADAIKLICEVDKHLVAPEGTSEIEMGQLRQDYIVENTKNPDAIFFITIWRTKPPAEQVNLLTQEAVEQKLPECPLAKSIDAVER